MGMKIVAVLSTLYGLSWFINACLLFNAVPKIDDGKLIAFIVLTIIITLPQLIPPFLYVKWLISDNVNTRAGLHLGLRI